VAALGFNRLPVEALDFFKQIFRDGMQSEMVTSIEEGQPSAVPAAFAEALGSPF